MQNVMTKHYLWAVGEGLKALKPGNRLAGRYELKRDQIVLDTQPQNPVESPEEVPEEMVPYLKLFPHRLHIPQVYGMIPHAGGKSGPDIWLLEGVPITPDGESLWPELTTEWPRATALRQLSWLWQMAKLWHPCSRQGVASSLLNPKLIRVEGPIVRLLELQFDGPTANLKQLGQLWQSWIPSAQAKIGNFLKQLCQQMIDGELRTSDQLLSQLDRALLIGGRWTNRQLNITTSTDTGPTRSHNEDACFPEPGSLILKEPGPEALAIVCDGIGGQDAGEIASNQAIQVLQQRIQRMEELKGDIDPLVLITKLERSACAANDHICGRNDSENRQGRQRMGTTLVLALAHAHEMYVTHVGDSRAYWITPQGCYQVTLDDDVASREVRLGYFIYRDALAQAAAGALVQALGITSSATLHPTTQRFPIDDECVFLLCSDGLSDRDRVDEYWRSEILPILNSKTDLATIRDNLVKIANTKNGHDNVTIAVIHYQVEVKKEDLPEIIVPPVEPLNVDESTAFPDEYEHDPSMDTREIRFDQDGEVSNIRKTFLLPKLSEPKFWQVVIGSLFLLFLVVPLVYSLMLPYFQPRDTEQIDPNPTPTDDLSTADPQPTPTQTKPTPNGNSTTNKEENLSPDQTPKPESKTKDKKTAK